MQVLRTTSRIKRLFVSLEFHYNDSLNTKMQKQNEPRELKKLSTKVVNLIIFGIHCNTFFQQTSIFTKFSVKTSYEKFQWYKLQLYLQTSFSSIYPNSLRQKFVLPESTSNSQFTEYVQHQVLCQIQQQIYKFLLSPLIFT